MCREDLATRLRELVGNVICGRYEIRKPIAYGDMGTVFLARQLEVEREVAVKVLPPPLASEPDHVDRFEREARLLARLHHRNCLRVIDYGITDSGLRVVVTELIRGVDLRSLMSLPMDDSVAAGRIRQVLQGLAHAHECGVVHHDLKPENILVTRASDGGELLKIVDFGIAKLLGSQSGAHSTATGVMFGTPQYMSPEQALGQPVDRRTDLYAAGVLLYAMLAGRPPFTGPDPLVVTRAQVHAKVLPLPHTVRPGLAALAYRLLAKDPKHRPATAAVAIDALNGAMASKPDTAPKPLAIAPQPSAGDRWAQVAVAAGTALLLGLAVAYGVSHDRPGLRHDRQVAVMTVRDADQALARGETERAHEILAALIDRDPDNAQLLWRDGRALYVMGRADEAFDRYADALVRDDSLQEDAEFFAELDALMRRPDVRSKALDLALQRLDDLAHPFLLSLVNDPEHPPSFVERHRALDRLSSTRRWDEVDLDLHARLDLQQASAATDPCWAYGHGLDVVEDDPTLERLRFVRRYDPPRKEAGCSVAAARRQVLLSALTMVEATSEPDDGRS